MDLPPPPATTQYDLDGIVHVFDVFGMAWCEDEEISAESPVTLGGNPGDWPWCEQGCLDGLREEGYLD